MQELSKWKIKLKRREREWKFIASYHTMLNKKRIDVHWNMFSSVVLCCSVIIGRNSDCVRVFSFTYSGYKWKVFMSSSSIIVKMSSLRPLLNLVCCYQENIYSHSASQGLRATLQRVGSIFFQQEHWTHFNH